MRQHRSLHRRFLDACATLAQTQAPAPAPKNPRPYPNTLKPWIHRPPTPAELRRLIDQVQSLHLATDPPPAPTRPTTTTKPPPPPVARPITATLRTRTTTCGKAGCSACPHGPYLYAIIRTPANRHDVSLGSRPTAATFYRRLTKHLPPEMIRDLIQEWRSK